MALVPFKELLDDARKHHYTVAALNVLNLETAQAVAYAAEKSNSPVIMQVFHEHLGHSGADYMAAIAEVLSKHISVPISLSLDHGQSYAQAVECIESGFSGVMIDLSADDYKKNVSETRKVVDIAHKKGISVEAELGKVISAESSAEEISKGMTDPDIAVRFIEDTGIDALAVSIGTAHGFYAEKPRIDFERLEKIIKSTDCPIVVHGGSNTPDEDIIQMVKLGICKLNIGTDLMMGFEQGIRKILASSQDFIDLQKVLESGRNAEIEVCLQKFSLLNKFRT